MPRRRRQPSRKAFARALSAESRECTPQARGALLALSMAVSITLGSGVSPLLMSSVRKQLSFSFSQRTLTTAPALPPGLEEYQGYPYVTCQWPAAWSTDVPPVSWTR